MNKQEAIEWLKDIKESEIEALSDWSYDVAIDMAIEALQDDWVPVSEGLPEEYDQYLCYCADDIYFVYWLENKPWAETKVKEEEIIAWRPLPEPYMDSGTKMDKELEHE